MSAMAHTNNRFCNESEYYARIMKTRELVFYNSVMKAMRSSGIKITLKK